MVHYTPGIFTVYYDIYSILYTVHNSKYVHITLYHILLYTTVYTVYSTLWMVFTHLYITVYTVYYTLCMVFTVYHSKYGILCTAHIYWIPQYIPYTVHFRYLLYTTVYMVYYKMFMAFTV